MHPIGEAEKLDVSQETLWFAQASTSGFHLEEAEERTGDCRHGLALAMTPRQSLCVPTHPSALWSTRPCLALPRLL